MDVTPDNHTRWYQGIQRIYRNAVVSHVRNTLRREYPQSWESDLQKPFAKEWPTIVENANLPRQIGVISSTIRDEADYLGVNHFHNLFEVHFDLLFPTQGDSTPEARKQEKAAVLAWAKEIKTVRDPESHPPGDDMDLLDVVRQLDNARRICSKFDGSAADQLAALAGNFYSDGSSNFGRDKVQTSIRQLTQVTQDSQLQADALLLGPVQALRLESRVEQAQRLASDAPADAARLYAEIAETLREQFPGYADRFERLGAVALRAAGDPKGSHDRLMQLAIRGLWDRAEPKVGSEVTAIVEELDTEVDAIRQARGRAIVHFGGCHEYTGELEKLAECFESLGPEDEFAPAVAALTAEAALADRAFQFILDRRESLHRASAGGNKEIELRVLTALGDAGVSDVWSDLIDKATSLRFPPAEGTYLCLRGARWCAWNGQLDKAQSLYRLATKLGSEVGLDLDVENALWSLTAIYSLGDNWVEHWEELSETNRMALSIEGSRSYVKVNSRTELRSYQYLTNRQLPDAHLWAQYRLLEAIRSGCLKDELDSHTVLSRIYSQSDEKLYALEHAILGGSQQLVNEVAQSLDEWPQFLSDMIVSKAPWVRRNAFLALEYVGDLAPPDSARRIVPELLRELGEAAYDPWVAPALLKALGTLILDAADGDVEQLMPYLERFAAREPDTYLLTDPGVMTLATRLYRFRPTFRQRAAALLGEMAIGSHTGKWSQTLDECGDDTSDLIEAFERVAERENIDVARSLSDLDHLTGDTRAIWLHRLQFVADHPLGQRSEHTIGPRYDVPTAFLQEQSSTVALQYLNKLIAIGCDVGEFLANRAAAFAAAANVADTLSASEKGKVFERVRSLMEQPIQISSIDQYHASTQHPLSRFRMSFGSATNVQASVGWLLARTATSPGQCSAVAEFALDWVRSDDSTLQEAGADILTLPNLSSGMTRGSELAKHGNPSVRRRTVRLLNMQESPDPVAFEQLADDPDRNVRIALAIALADYPLKDTDAYKRMRGRLNGDTSAIVRACASAL